MRRLLGSAASNATRLDTYLLVLAGHGRGSGTVLGVNDDYGSSSDSRLAGGRLSEGDYTIEATTFGAGRTGGYFLNVSAVIDSVSVTAVSGGTCAESAEAPPAGISAVWDCDVNPGEQLRVLANARSAQSSFAHRWTAAGGVTLVGAPQTLPLQSPDSADHAYRRASRVTLDCTAPGTAEVTVTAGSGSYYARTRTHRLVLDCTDPVRISDLDDRDVYSPTGARVTVAEPFTVDPASAACTSAPTGTVTTPPNGTAADRVLRADVTVGTAATLTVTCTNAGRDDGVETVRLAATSERRVTSVTVTATSGGSCTKPPSAPSAPPEGIDAVLDCTIAAGASLRLSVSADANANGPTLRWATGGGIRRTRSTQAWRAVPLVGPAGSSPGWRRTGTATLTCTADGTATLTASLPGAAADHVTRLEVDCEQPVRVRIDGFYDATETGTGTVTVSDRFTVTPATARCTATATTGTPRVTAGTAGARTVSLGVSAGASADVTVRCNQTSHAPATARATFTARAPSRCGEHLGVLGNGVTTRRDRITADSQCTSPQRRSNPGSRLYYARRHTFTLASPATVTIDVTAVGSMDTYMLLLRGRSSDGSGTVAGRNDDGGPGLSSRLSNLRLQAGDYTVEATTYGDRRTGTYDLRVQVVGSTAAAVCDHDLGTLAAGQYTRSGTITADNACTAEHRGSATNPYRARRHTFRLDAPAWVDIDLAKTSASSLDPYLVLVNANGGTPTVVEQDNNDGPANAAQIRGRYLEAGDYVIEATTATANGNTANGDYTLTVTVPIHGLVATNTATVDEQTTLTFDYWPPNAQVAISAAASEELQPTVTTTTAGTTHGTAAVTVTPRLVRVHDDVAVRVRTGNRIRSYGPITLAVQQPCNEYLGGLETGRIARSGAITNDTECTSTRRLDKPGNPGTYYARRYAFTVDSPGWVTVNLEAQDPNTLDTHLILLRGHGGTGTVIDSDDNSGPSTNSRLADVFLQPGSYTIETTTKSPGATGNYTLTINATITGLQPSYSATVGRELRIDFDLGNHQATATASHADFGLTARRAGSTGTLLVVSDSTNARSVTVSFSKAGVSAIGQRSASGAQSSDIYMINFLSTCGTHQIVDPEFGRCIWNEEDLQEERGSRYLVTPALLAGVRRAAKRAMNEYSGDCDMTPTRLAALMLAIGIYETNPIGEFSPARSLMFLSRVDRPPKAYPDDDPTATRVDKLRAFWHPGVGYWQLDWWPNELNHAERADVDLGGYAVAKHIRTSYCDGSQTTLKNNLLNGAWNGCIPDAKKDANERWIKDTSTGLIVGTHECFDAHEDIYLGGDLGDPAYKGAEDLWVTTSGNESLTNKKGGVQPLKCRWGTTGTGFACWFYDTDNHEGNISDWRPEGVWTGDHKRSPLSAPFISFTDEDDNGNRNRFAVFPESFAYHSRYTDSDAQVTWFKRVPIGSGRDFRVRTAPGNTWDDNDHGGNVLKVEDTSRWVMAGTDSFRPWVNVADAQFKTVMREIYPDTSDGQ